MIVLEAVVVAELPIEVGRTGAPGWVPEDIDEERGGHRAEPQARPVGQQPPPRDAGQERNPEEQVKEVGRVVDEVGAGAADVVVGVVDVVVGAVDVVAGGAEEES